MSNSNQTPSVGRMVHYFAGPDEGIKPGPWPCIITAVNDDLINVVCFGAGKACREFHGLTTDQWSWPERAHGPGLESELGIEERLRREKIAAKAPTVTRAPQVRKAKSKPQ